MKNLEMLDYLRKAEAAAYDRMLLPSVFTEGYEYHRGKYDQTAVLLKGVRDRLKLDAEVLNNHLDALILDLQAQLKWTALPWRRHRFQRVINQLSELRETE